MNDALVEAVDPQGARMALKKVANRKATAREPHLPFAQLAGKYIRKTSLEQILINTRSNRIPIFHSQ